MDKSFDRTRVLTLLYEDREKLREFKRYVNGAIGGYRGAFYDCLRRVGYVPRRNQPTISDLTGLKLDNFLELVKKVPSQRYPRCARYVRIIRMLSDRVDEIDNVIDSLFVQGKDFSDVQLLTYAIESIEGQNGEIDVLDDLEDDLRYAIATERSRDMADRAVRYGERAEDKIEEFKSMLPPEETFRERTVIALYIIIESEREGKRYYKQGEYSVKRKYPSGEFEAQFDITAVKKRYYDYEKDQWVVVTQGYEKLPMAKRDFLHELDEWFEVGSGEGVAEANYVEYDTNDITVGGSNLAPKTKKNEDPYKRTLGRMVDEADTQTGMSPRDDWQYTIEDFAPSHKSPKSRSKVDKPVKR